MAPPAKRVRFNQSPVRRSSRIQRRPDRYGVESPRRCALGAENDQQSSSPADAPVLHRASCVTSTDLRSSIEVRHAPSECCAALEGLQSRKQQCGLLDLPPDILRMLFSMFTFQVLHTVSQTLATGLATFLAQQVSQSLRPVCRQLHHETGRFLNSALLALGSRLSRSLRALEMQLTCAQDEVEWRAASRAYSALETVYSQYRLVEAVIWRWLSPRHTWDVTGRDVTAASVAATSAGCCYAGRFLDDLHRLATTAVTAPDDLVTAALSQRAKIDAAVTRFINYFEKTAGGSAWRRSAQMVDLLDCLLAARYTATREVTETEAAAGICKLRGRYALPRAWFTSLLLGNSSPTDTTSDDARLMALRLRRLVRSSNEHHLDTIQREREAAALPSFGSPPLAAYLPSPASTYSGFGESANRFFYYGSMNERAAKAREATETSQTPAQQPNNSNGVEQDGDLDYEPPLPAEQRGVPGPGADNHSESSGEEHPPAESDEARSELDENELALLEADAARDMNDILADMELAGIPPPEIYNDEDDLLPVEGDPPDVDDYRWMDEVNPFQLEIIPSDAEVVASLDESMNAEAESTGVPCSVTPSTKVPIVENTEKENLPEKDQVEDEELLEGSDLLFDVDLTCPMELAPLAIYRKFEFAAMEYEASKLSKKTSKAKKCGTAAQPSTSKRSGNESEDVELVQEDPELDDSYGFPVPFHLVLTIRCPTSARNRLPPIYVYEAKSSKS